MASSAHSHVLVTGASSGIGKATALHLAARGYHVFAGVRKLRDGSLLQAAPGEITPLMIDVTDVAQVTAAAETVAKHVADGGLAGLVNNAGIGVFSPLELIPLGAFRHQMEVNVIGQLAVTQAFLPAIRAARGTIVFIGSVGDRIVLPFIGPLASSKFALAAMAEAFRQELAPWGIRVILIEPGTIASEAGSKLESNAEQLLRESPSSKRALYEKAFRGFAAGFAAGHRKGSAPQMVAESVSHVLAAARPPARHLVGKNSRLLAVMATLPAPIGDAIRRRLFHLPAPGSLR